jgi:two-component system OmpR family response regulator
MRILDVEDEPKVANALREGLEGEQFEVVVERTGEGAFFRVTTETFDLVLLDLGLPGRDGLEILSALRQRRLETPVLILTARDTVQDRVLGLDAGADDYLVKPFAFAELLARVQALVRRASGPAEATRLSLGDLEMDLLSREVRRSGRKVDLRPKEWALLEYLMRNAGKVVSKTMILAHVYDYSFDPGTNVVDVLVHRLRDKIDRDFEHKMLATVRGAGYVLRG